MWFPSFIDVNGCEACDGMVEHGEGMRNDAASSAKRRNPMPMSAVIAFNAYGLAFGDDMQVLGDFLYHKAQSHRCRRAEYPTASGVPIAG